MKDQLPTIKELQNEIESLSCAIDDKVQVNDFDAAEILISQLESKQTQLQKEEVVESRMNIDKIHLSQSENQEIWESRDKVDMALTKALPSEAKEISTQYLAKITNNWKDELGSGGFGSVLKGVDEVNCNVVAVKRFHSHFLVGCTAEDIQKQYAAEIMALSKMNHPNIVRLLAYATSTEIATGMNVSGHHCDFYYLVYEYAAGGSMQTILENDSKRQAYDWQLRIQSCLSLVSALRYLHKQGFNHRDVKPDNICFTDDSCLQLILIDFGIASAKCFDGEKVQSTVSANPGTPPYQAPEYAFRQKFTERSEVFSVGVVIAALITGSSSVGWVRESTCTSKSLVDKVDLIDWDQAVVLQLADLAITCMKNEQMDHPSFDELESTLHELKEKSLLPLTPKETTSMNQFLHTHSTHCQVGACKGEAVHCACGQIGGSGLHCKNGHFVCCVCLEQHVVDQLGAARISCPHSQCRTYFSVGDLYEKISKHVFVQHYESLVKTESFILSESTFKSDLIHFKHQMNEKLDAVLKGVALSVSGKAKCPRLCVLWPLKSRRGHCLSVTREFRLFFLCAYDRSPIETFIQVHKPKKWVKHAVPALKFTLFALRVLSLVGGLPLPLPQCIPGDGIDSKLSAVAVVMRDFLNGRDIHDFEDWLDDIHNGGPQDEKSVLQLLGSKEVESEAYGAILDVADQPGNRGWRDEMVLANKGDTWAWVKNANVQKWMASS